MSMGAALQSGQCHRFWSFAFRRRPDRSECRTTVGNSAEQGVLHLSVRISRFIPDFRRPTKREVWVGTAHPAAYAQYCSFYDLDGGGEIDPDDWLRCAGSQRIVT